MDRDCFIDYPSALVIAISGKRKRIGILLTALLFITLCPLQISTAALIDSNISAGSNLLARTQINQTGSEEPINKKYLPETRSLDSQRQRSRWRGKWLMASPSQQGFDSVRLEKAVSQIGRMKGVYSFILVRNGYIVVERYFREGRQEKPHNLKSASKSVLSALVGIAIDEGYMHLDQSIAELLPQMKTFDDPRKGAITVRHLLTMTSGLEPTSYQAYNSWVSKSDWVKAVLDRPMIYDPGTRFQYSTGNSHILSAILTATTGISTKAFAERKLFGPLNIKVQGWDTDPEGIYLGGNNLSLVPRDMAKFGQLFLDGGRFGSHQVVSKWWVDESTRASDIGAHDVYGAYGYYWYVRPRGEDAFVAVGHGGQYIYVSPLCDSVIVVTSTLGSKGQTWEEKLFEQLQFGILGSLDKKERLLLHAVANPEDTEISQLKGQTTANVILRSGPSRESSRLDLVNTGRFVTILETEGRWHRVRFRNKIGWLYGGFVRLQSTKLKSKSARTNTYLNLRTGPGISYKVIRRLKPATSLTIKDQTGSWLLVQAESHEGWINRNYITFEPPAAPVLVTLKDEASVTDKKVVVSKQGKQLVSAGVETKEAIADVKELKDVVERIHSRLEASEEQRQQLSGEFDSIRRNWSAQKDAIDESTRESKKIITDMAESRQEIEKLKQTVTDARAGRENLNKELVQARQKIEKLGKYLQESLSDRKKLTTEVSALRKELESRGAAEVTSATESKKLVTDMAESRQEIEKLRQTVTDAQTGREKLNRELVQARQEIEKLGKHLQESLSDRKKLTTEVSALRKELESQRKLTAKSTADRKNLASNLSSASGQIASLEKALKDSQDSHKKNLTEMAKIYAELESQRESTVNLESTQNMLVSKLSSAIEQISKLNKELQNFQQSRNDLVARIAKLDQELNTRPKARVSQKKTTKKQPQKLIKKTPASKKIASRTSKKLPFNRLDAAAIDKFLRSWTDTWSRKDVGGYLSHYSLTYKPGGDMSFKKWQQQRQKSLERPAFIEVVVERVKKEMKDTGRAKVTFLQHYRSDLHTDSVIKTLDLIREEDGWKIIKEKSKLIKLKFLGF